jgi:hypothetical protein
MWEGKDVLIPDPRWKQLGKVDMYTLVSAGTLAIPELDP